MLFDIADIPRYLGNSHPREGDRGRRNEMVCERLENPCFLTPPEMPRVTVNVPCRHTPVRWVGTNPVGPTQTPGTVTKGTFSAVFRIWIRRFRTASKALGKASMLKCPSIPVRYRLSSSEIPSSSRIRWGNRTCLYSRFSRTVVTSSLVRD